MSQPVEGSLEQGAAQATPKPEELRLEGDPTQGTVGSGDLVAVTLGEGEETDAVHRAQLASRQLEADEAPELWNPEATALDVDLLPTTGLDV